MTRRATALALAALAGAGCGGEASRDEADRSRKDPFATVEGDRARGAKAVRAAPRWERVTTLRGSADDDRRLEIGEGAIQWRVRWRCRSGAMRVVARLPRGAVVGLGRSRCPRGGEGTAVVTGPVTLEITADGPWRARVEQQVDTPLREPPPEALRSGRATRVGAGRFYGLERRGRGTAVLHRVTGGRLALRLERFETAASADLFVWLSRSPRPRSSREALRRRHVEIAPLKATAGDQNYLLPAGLTAADARSVVIWCEPVRIAYAAAPLSATGWRAGRRPTAPRRTARRPASRPGPGSARARARSRP